MLLRAARVFSDTTGFKKYMERRAKRGSLKKVAAAMPFLRRKRRKQGGVLR
jgi:hypothetical protein